MAVGEKELKKSLLENLESRGMVEKLYEDKVEEYMRLWKLCRELEKDVKERGVVVYDEKKGAMADNSSVKQLVGVSKQLLAIYTALGFKDAAKGAGAGRGADDDL